LLPDELRVHDAAPEILPRSRASNQASNPVQGMEIANVAIRGKRLQFARNRIARKQCAPR
jgi:hypothetical protein